MVSLLLNGVTAELGQVTRRWQLAGDCNAAPGAPRNSAWMHDS
jgi:hypothetical protein